MLPSLMSPQALLLAARHTDAIKDLEASFIRSRAEISEDIQ